MARHQGVDLAVIRKLEAERDAARDERDRVVQQLRASRTVANFADEAARMLGDEIVALAKQHDKQRAELEKALRKAYQEARFCYLCERPVHKADCPLR